MVVVKDHLPSARSLVTAEQAGFLFYSNCGAERSIVRTVMDGSEAAIIVSSNYGCGVDLALSGESLFWVDSELGAISEVLWDGTRQRILKRLGSGIGNGHARLLFFHDVLLYIVGSELFQLSPKTAVTDRLRRMPNLLVALTAKPVSTDPNQSVCQGVKCDHLCVRSRLGVKPAPKCKCAIGYQMHGTRCTKKMENFLIFTTGTGHKNYCGFKV